MIAIRHRGGSFVTVLAVAGVLAAAAPAWPARGDCCQPVSDGGAPVASDCLFILRTAVGLETCTPACICAPKGTLPTLASDALLCLKLATGQDVELNCPCGAADCGAFASKFGAERLVEPHGIAVDDDGDVYVADSELDEVVKFDATGAFVKSWGGNGSANGQLVDPRGIAVGPNGRVYVADNGNYRVQVFEPDGTFVSAWGSFCFLSQGTGCVDPDGAGPLETGDGQFVEPYAIAVHPGGDVYVTDASNSRVQVFDAGGAFETKWTVAGVPRAIAVGPDTVYVAPGNHSIAAYDLDGTLVGGFAGFCRIQDGAGCVDPDGAGPLELGDGQMFQFLGHITHADSSIFVVDDGNYRVQWLDGAGAFRAKWGSACCFVDGIGCIDPDGGGPLETGDGQLCSPTGVAVDAAGRVLVADFNARIQRFDCPDLRD